MSMMAHHVRGSFPRACLWEVGVKRCAALPNMPTAASWSPFRASVTPDAGTTGLILYLYADAAGQGRPTIDEYSDVRVLELATVPNLVLIATPDSGSSSSLNLVVLHNSFSTQWQSAYGTHVLVDGMVNGWLVQPGSGRFSASYVHTGTVRAAQLISLAPLLIALGIPVWFIIRHLIVVTKRPPSDPSVKDTQGAGTDLQSLKGKEPHG